MKLNASSGILQWLTKRFKANWWKFLAALLMITILPAGRALADIGPKPSLNFDFFFLPGVAKTDISKGELLECQDEDCLVTKPMETFGAQHLDCELSWCSGTVYGASSETRYRLRVEFSDSSTRISNPFSVSTYKNIYYVTVYQSGLSIRRDAVRSNNAIFAIFMTVATPWVGLAIPLFLFLFIFGSRKFLFHLGEARSYSEARVPYLIIWTLVIIVTVISSFATLALLFTVIIEVIVAILYTQVYWPKQKARFGNRGGTLALFEYTTENRPALATMITVVVLVNLITQPALWIVANYSVFGIPIFLALSWPILLLEVIVCLVEAWLLRITYRNLRSEDAWRLSVMMNTISFLIGLFLIV